MLFNKNGKGADEIKAIIGFSYRSMKYDNLLPYLEFAERDLVSYLINQSLIDAAQTHYDSNSYLATPIAPIPAPPNETAQNKAIREALNASNVIINALNALKDQLVQKIQSPLIRHALRMYFPSSDVQHTESGRSIIVTNEQKPAFEWQIEKDNANMLELAHRSEEALMDFLFANQDDDPLDDLWKDSDAAKTARGLMINTAAEFSKIIFINNSRRVFTALVPLINEIERDIIKPCFLAADYDAIKALILSGINKIPENETDEAKIIRETIIEKYNKAIIPLAYYSIAAALTQFSVEVMPDGIFQNFYTNAIASKAIAKDKDRIGLAAYMQRKGDAALKKLQEYLTKLTTVAAGETYTPVDSTERMDETQKYCRP